MLITFENIIEIDDILFNISKYLPFEYKITFGKICNKNLIKFYDFNSDNYTYKKLYDLMEPDDEYIMDIKYYIDYHKILEKYIQKNKKIYLESNKLDYVDFQEKTNDEIYSLPINEFLNLIEYYRRYNRYRNIFDEDLEDILFRSIYGIYVRIMIEYIEYNDISQDDVGKLFKAYNGEESFKKELKILKGINNLDPEGTFTIKLKGANAFQETLLLMLRGDSPPLLGASASSQAMLLRQSSIAQKDFQLSSALA